MNPPNLSRAYVSNTVNSATPGQLIVMLYDGLIRFATDARDAMKEGQTGAEPITRSIRILTELNICLRREVAPEFCDRLSKLYEYYTMEISRAMHRRNPQIIDDIIPLIKDLRDAWEAADNGQGPAKAAKLPKPPGL